MIVNAIILSNNIYVIKNILNNVHIEISYKIVAEMDELIAALKKSSFDIIFVEKKFNIDLNNKYLKQYENHIVSIEENTDFVNNSIIEKFSQDKIKDKIVSELQYLGYNSKHYGTNYLIEAILYAYKKQDRQALKLEGELYPYVAKKCNKTVSNVKSSVNRATECMYYECDIKRLKKYFHFSEDLRPTVMQVIIAVIKNI